MSWIVYSFIALFSMVIFALSVKWALNLKIVKEKLLLYIFLGYFVGYFILNLKHFDFIFAPERIWTYILWGLLAAIFSIFGNYLSAAAVQKVPNPGYTEAIKGANSILTVFLSYLLFGSSITWMKLLGVALIPLGILPLLSKKVQKENQNWQRPAIFSALLFVGMFMVFKQMSNLGFSSAQILLILSFFAVIGYLIINYVTKDKLPKKQHDLSSYRPVLIAIIIGLVANLVNVTAIRLAPNIGYTQAIMNSQAVLVLVLSRQFFKKDEGGEFDFKKWLGVILVVLAVILIVLSK